MKRFSISTALWIVGCIACFLGGRATMEEKVRAAYEDLVCSETFLTCYEPLAIYDPHDPQRPNPDDLPENESLYWCGNKFIHGRQIHDLPPFAHGPSLQAQSYIGNFPDNCGYALGHISHTKWTP